MIDKYRGCGAVLTGAVALTILMTTTMPANVAAGEKACGKMEKFEPTWESVQRYTCPEWFRDAKFGIYAHWGVYSAARGTRNTDWYGRNMYKKGHPNYEDHLRNHGPVDKFGYKDLIPLFTGENFNADEWVDLYIEAGARFAGPVGEHADGFSMWASKVNPWNAAAMGPKRDIVAEMEEAVRKRGLKFLVSMHHQWLWGWFPTWDEGTDCADPKYASLYGPKYPPTAQGKQLPNGHFDNLYAYPAPSEEFERVWLEKIREVVEGYSPDLLWFDNRMTILTEKIRKEMVAMYLNHGLERDQEVVLTYKRPDLMLGAGTVDLERARMPDIFPEPWLTDTSISRTSWSYAEDIEYYSPDRLIDDLVDIVSKNGCLLLNIAPAPDGTIPEEQKPILREIGAWLRLNGEAIYGSRPWLLFGEGPTKTPEGHLADLHFNGFTEKDIRFTTNNGYLYAIALGWPEKDGRIVIESLGAARYNDGVKAVSLIGHDGELSWKVEPDGLVIELPEKRPCDYAYVFRITRG